jgi:hypothetical protein
LLAVDWDGAVEPQLSGNGWRSFQRTDHNGLRRGGGTTILPYDLESDT